MKTVLLALALIIGSSQSSYAIGTGLFVSGNFGMMASFEQDGEMIEPTYGARVGYEILSLGVGTLTGAFAYNDSGLDFASFAAVDIQEFMFQGIIRRALTSGLYFGGQLGSIKMTTSAFNIVGPSVSYFSYGALAGYEFNSGGLITYGPEVHLQRFSTMTYTKFLVNISVNL